MTTELNQRLKEIEDQLNKLKSSSVAKRRIRLLKRAIWQREWRKKNPDKKRKNNAEWYKKYGKEYSRKYRQSKKKLKNSNRSKNK